MVRRARAVAENRKVDLTSNFTESSKISATKPMKGRERSQFAAYLVAMKGDPNKSEVAAAEIQQVHLNSHFTESSKVAVPGASPATQGVAFTESRKRSRG